MWHIPPRGGGEPQPVCSSKAQGLSAAAMKAFPGGISIDSNEAMVARLASGPAGCALLTTRVEVQSVSMRSGRIDFAWPACYGGTGCGSAAG